MKCNCFLALNILIKNMNATLVIAQGMNGKIQRNKEFTINLLCPWAKFSSRRHSMKFRMF